LLIVLIVGFIHKTFSFFIWHLPNHFAWSNWHQLFVYPAGAILNFDQAIGVFKVLRILVNTWVAILEFMLSCFGIYGYSSFLFQHMGQGLLLDGTFLFEFAGAFPSKVIFVTHVAHGG
jgi:hypothetical protein